jgi:hypothetical protein
VKPVEVAKVVAKSSEKSDMSERILRLRNGQEDQPPAFQIVTSGCAENLRNSRAVPTASSPRILNQVFSWRIV